jgi:hypothetical protein
MDKIVEWSPWLKAMLLCGSINAIVAYRRLYEDAKSPFFKPWKFFGFYIWLLIEISIPAIFFWFYGKVGGKPDANSEFYISAITVGFFFTILVNSNSDLGFVSFSIDKFYGELRRLAYNQIASTQTAKLTRFKQQLKQHLTQNTTAAISALDYLKDYVNSDVALKLDEQARLDYLQQIQSALQQTDILAKAEATSGIAEQVLRPRDYPEWLKTIQAPQPLLKSLK